MRKILFITLALVVVSCNNSNTKDPIENKELDEFISRFDDKSIEEIKEEVNVNVREFEGIIKFFDGAFTNKIEHIKKEDERYGEAFKIDTTGISKALNQFNDISFLQSFNAYESEIEFEFGNPEKRQLLALGEGVSQWFAPSKIYYHNGEVKIDSIASYDVDFNFDEAWGEAKPIDSIDITYNIKYLEDYDVIELSTDKPKISYKGGEIILQKTEGNYAYLTFSDTIPTPTKTQGYNVENKILNGSGSSTNGISPKDSEGVFTEMLGYFKILQEKFNDNDFEDTAEFQAFLKNNLSHLDFFNDTDGLFHKQYYYYGNVNSVKIYFAKETKTEEVTFRARNLQTFSDDNELFEMPTEEGLLFLNNKGETKIKLNNLDSEIEKLAGNFYEDSDYFYFLNREEKRLDTLLVYDIEIFNHNLIGILNEQDNDDYVLFNHNYERVSDKTYYDMHNIGDILVGDRNDAYYIIDEFGKETLLSEVYRIDQNDFFNDRIVVENKKGKRGYINAKGQQVISFKYDSAESFEDGIAVAKLNDTYKLIDVKGKILVETGEKSIGSFGEDEEGKRIYNFSYRKKQYNYKGELIKDETED